MTSLKRKLRQMTDSQLVTEFNAGEPGAFFVIYERYFPILHYHVLHLLKDPQACQKILVQAFRTVTIENHIAEDKPVKLLLYLAVRTLTIKHIKEAETKFLRSLKDYVFDVTQTQMSTDRSLANYVDSQARFLPKKEKTAFNKVSIINLPDYQ
ncbi:hypothetical protein M9991_12220 [Chryseobacterium gallinarum]|uniref:hypothetical protein n=1 Tax=Chryseobacterium gallinarum TaxID=1324352 RepID=UPI0020258BE8|nr:hypothetical protein [Chryseobacterium gallinarum]MCL8537629.1 hypothetical protein [Chryseobacterium gallinarum]